MSDNSSGRASTPSFPQVTRNRIKRYPHLDNYLNDLLPRIDEIMLHLHGQQFEPGSGCRSQTWTLVDWLFTQPLPGPVRAELREGRDVIEYLERILVERRDMPSAKAFAGAGPSLMPAGLRLHILQLPASRG